ncbi:MAG: PcfJ domain-containing protein [Treponema sp.]|nr:PcfJ domain-containing protein [Treponema sp.]
MTNGYWGYNIKECKYEQVEEEPFSLFPTIIEPKQKIVFCRQCHRWEYIIHFNKNILTTQCGKKYVGPFVVENAQINFYYKIQKIKDAYAIKIKSQTASLQNRIITESNYLLDINKKVLYKDGKSVFENEDIGNSMCKELTKEILEEMGENYKKLFGIKPTVASQLSGFNVIIGYMLSPFNVNFFTIAQHWGLNPYDKDFASLSSGDTPTAENEMFASLGIKPTKAVRKMYQKYPQSVICYAAALDLGFSDVNILQRTPSVQFYAFLKYCMISFAGGFISYTTREHLKYFVEDMLQLTNQKTVWNSIERTLNYFANANSKIYNVIDGITTYGRIHRQLTENEKREIMQEGFNEYSHNYLIRRAEVLFNDTQYHFNQENITFDIEPSFLALEYKAGDDKKRVFNPKTKTFDIVDVQDSERYCFYVARDSDTLRMIGSAMHNCVGWGYANSVKNRHCTIVYGVFKNQYRICIEVTPDFTIRQSLGPCNHPLVDKDLEAYREWCIEKNINFVKAFAIHTAI